VPAGSPVELDVRLESVTEGVYVSGTAHARLEGECARCLDPLTDEITVQIGELFAYPDSVTDETTEEDELPRVVDDRVDLFPRNSLGADPKWQFVGSSDMDLTPKLRLTLDLRGVGPLDLPPDVPGYVEAGGKLGYALDERVELFLAARNLLHRTHLENGDGSAQLIKRSVYARTRLRF
jgi:hypothetical protein